MVRSRAAGFAGLGFRISGLGFRASSRGFGYPHSGGQSLNDPTLKFIGLVANKNLFSRGYMESLFPYSLLRPSKSKRTGIHPSSGASALHGGLRPAQSLCLEAGKGGRVGG